MRAPLLAFLVLMLPAGARAQDEDVDADVAAATAVAGLAPSLLGAIAVGLTEELDPGAPEVVGAVVPLLVAATLAPTIGWLAIGEERAALANLALDVGFLALGAGLSGWAAAALDLPAGETILRGLSWTSVAVLGFAGLLSATQASEARGLGVDAASQDRALAIGSGALGALAGGAIAAAFALADGGPRWREMSIALGAAALSPALGWASIGEWERAGEALFVSLAGIAFAALVAAVAAPLVQDPDLSFEDAFAQGFALGSAVYLPLAALLHLALGDAERE